MTEGHDPHGPFRAPNWVQNVDAGLSFCSQFVLYGNIHDVQCGPSPAGPWELPLVDCLWQRLEARHYAYVLVFNSTGGLRLLPQSRADEVAAALAPLGGAGSTYARALAMGEDCPFAVADLPTLIQAVYASPLRGGLVLENASRLAVSVDRLRNNEFEMFAECERQLRIADPHRGPERRELLFNPVFWLVDRIEDLPPWLVAAGERSRPIAVPMPDEEARSWFAYSLGSGLARDLSADELRAATLPFSRLSEGLGLSEMAAVAQVAQDQGVPLERIVDAIRAYKVGKTEDPWRKPVLRDHLAKGNAIIRERLKGQDRAVAKALDILKRAAIGLSGAQAATSIGRPRGIVFLAGPTGVGKTQLAKAIGELIFGSPDSVIRFDMAEYTAEHSEARLIGAPPGFVGYEQGGALVKAVRDRPFSVLLFDEIEKAHPRILDKFLQILEDGRLTDGRGDTVYFSESIIIFTSNLGVFKEVGAEVVQQVHPGDDYELVRKTIEDGVRQYFHQKLQRPELLNRIGMSNVIVFDFIDPPTAQQIFRSNLGAIVARVMEELQITLRIDDAVAQKIEEHAIKRLDDGGRGIGNAMENCLINPLSRALFDGGYLRGDVLKVSDVHQPNDSDDGLWSLELTLVERPAS